MPDLVTDAIEASAAIYFSRAFSFPGWNVTGWTKAIFVIKRLLEDTDRDALLLIRVTNPADAAADGVKARNFIDIVVGDSLRAAGSVAVTAVNPATVTVTATESAMDISPTPTDGIYWWEVDVWITGQGKRQLGRGEFRMTQAVWRGLTAP